MINLHPIADYMYSFFHQFLAAEKGLSTNSILAYRDAIKLLLCFTADLLEKKVDQLNIEDLDEKIILSFLGYLENERKCSARTRNARLAAIRTFFDFIGRREPALLQQCLKIRGIPQKRFEHKAIDYLESNEMQSIFDAVDINSRTEVRDKALLLVLYNTGARVSEVADIKINDVRLEAPGQVKLIGKGKKQRACPLWPETVNAIKNYLRHRQPKNTEEEHLFLNANGESITRFGIRYIIQKYAQKAAQTCPVLKEKTVGPHTVRHSTAIHLI